MASISAPGVGSGLDTGTLITKLMAVERRPITLLTQQKSDINTKISALGSLKSALTTLQTAAKKLSEPATFAQHTATVANEAVATVSAGTGAAAGSYDLVVTSLAKSHKLLSAGFASATAAVTNGSLTIELGSVSGGTFTVNPDKTPRTITVDASNNTLTGLRDAINNAGAGVTASIVNDAPGSYRLLVSSTEGGTKNLIRLSGIAGLDYDPAAATGTFSQQVAASNAQFSIDGIAFTRTSNTVSDAVTGLTLNLKATNVGTPTRISVTQENTATLASVKELVSAYNAARSNLKAATAYNATTKTGSPLTGDVAARTAGNKLSDALTHMPAGLTGAYQTLGQIGVSLGSDGTLTLNETKFNAALTANRTDTVKTLQAYASALETAVSGLTGSTGTISTRTTLLNDSIAGIGKRIDALETRMAAVESRYKAQFTALDTLMGSLNNTSNFLATQLKKL